MFSFVVKRLGFLKSVPLLALLFDSWLKIGVFLTKPILLDWLDDIETEFLSCEDTSVSLHKYGGVQFNFRGQEIAHIHSNGILDVLFNSKIKAELMREGRIQEHHVFKTSGWISFYIQKKEDVEYAKSLLKMACLKRKNGTFDINQGDFHNKIKKL